MDDIDLLKVGIEEATWHNYTKKCKRCGGKNTYRMKKTTLVIDRAAIESFLEFAAEALEGLRKAIRNEHPK